MSAGPSSSRNHDAEQQSLNDLSSVFPQIDTGVLRAVLHQEGSYEAAVEALLISVEGSSSQQTQNDEQIARALQAQANELPYSTSWPALSQVTSDQVFGASSYLWGSMKQAASDVSESVANMALNVTSMVAPTCLHGEAEDPEFRDEQGSRRMEGAMEAPQIQETKKEK